MKERLKLPLKTIVTKTIVTKYIMTGAIILAIGAALFYRLVLFAQPVEVSVVSDGLIQEEVKGPGSVHSWTEVTVSSRIPGLVERVLVQEGEQVKQGQLLVAIDDRDLAAKVAAGQSVVAAAQQNVAVAQAGLEKSEADLSLARGNFKREEEVFRAGHLSHAAFDMITATQRVAESALKNGKAVLAARRAELRRAEDEARYAEAIRTQAQITSPLAGLVTMRQIEAGSTIAPGNTLFRIVDDQAVYVATRIDVSQIGRIRVGQNARIRLASKGEATGSVVRISHESDPVTRDQEVRVRFDTPLAHLTLQEEAEVIISVGEARGLVIPGSAVLPLEGVDGVLVVREGRIQRVAVQVGAIGQGKTQILSGLSVGDQIISRPENFKTGQRVRPQIGEE